MDEDDKVIAPDDDSSEASQNQQDNQDNQDNNQPAPKETDGEIVGGLVDNDNQEQENNGSQEEGAEGAEGGEEDKGDDNQENEEDNQPTPPLPKEPVQERPKVDDPGEFKPKDYSFEVELADGKKFKVTKPEDIDDLPETPEFKTLKDHTAFISNYTRMVNGIERDKTEHETRKAEYEAYQASEEKIQQSVDNIVAEMNYLEAKGKLPKYDAKYDDADWSDPEVAKQPGVKERLDLLDYRDKENGLRFKSGLPPMSLMEAMAQMENEGYKQQADDKQKKQNDLRKKKGAMVGGSGGSQYNNVPTDIIIGEGGSIRDISAEY